MFLSRRNSDCHLLAFSFHSAEDISSPVKTKAQIAAMLDQQGSVICYNYSFVNSIYHDSCYRCIVLVAGPVSFQWSFS